MNIYLVSLNILKQPDLSRRFSHLCSEVVGVALKFQFTGKFEVDFCHNASCSETYWTLISRPVCADWWSQYYNRLSQAMTSTCGYLLAAFLYLVVQILATIVATLTSQTAALKIFNRLLTCGVMHNPEYSRFIFFTGLRISTSLPIFCRALTLGTWYF